jgi:HEPN domain-containing protein
MSVQVKRIGVKQGITDVSAEYARLADEDEAAGRFLQSHGHYRHAAYFFIQAMEKQVRAKIFQLVNPDNEYFRECTRTHNVDELLDFLVEIVGSTPLIREQVKGQLENNVLEGVRFGMLHNDLRYPFYQEKSRAHAVIVIRQQDSEMCCGRLERLKPFLRDIDRLRR